MEESQFIGEVVTRIVSALVHVMLENQASVAIHERRGSMVFLLLLVLTRTSV